MDFGLKSVSSRNDAFVVSSRPSTAAVAAAVSHAIASTSDYLSVITFISSAVSPCRSQLVINGLHSDISVDASSQLCYVLIVAVPGDRGSAQIAKNVAISLPNVNRLAEVCRVHVFVFI